MARTVTLTFNDGSTHVYQNVPDSVTPDQIEARASQDFAGRKVKGIDGGRAAAPQIPGLAPGDAGAPKATNPVQPDVQASLGDKVIGAGEAGLTALTGATGGTLGMLAGTLNGIAQEILSGKFGTAQAEDMVAKAANEGAAALTYAPRTPTGQQYAETLGNAAAQLIPIAPLAGEAAALGAAAKAARATPAPVLARAGAEGVARDAASLAARPAEAAGLVKPGAAGDVAAGMTARAGDAVAAGAAKAAQAGQAAAQKVSTIPRRALDAVLRRTPEEAQGKEAGNLGSVGAAGIDMADQRRQLAQSLGFEGDAALTRGQATRDAAQLKFETETAKMPDQGVALRERNANQLAATHATMEKWLDETGAQAGTKRAVGEAVDTALQAEYKNDKNKVRALYAEANKSPEANAVVDIAAPVSIGSGETALTSTPLDWINKQPANLPNTALLDAARQDAVRLGIAKMEGGRLVPITRTDRAFPDWMADQTATKQTIVQPTIRQMETWRKAINQRVGFEPSDIRDATILKGLIDGQTEPVAGPKFQQARAARARLAQNYEDHVVIRKLLSLKRGTDDRAVALEDVFSHSVLNGSLDDMKQVRRVLMRSGAQGHQAWSELRGAALRWIRDQASTTATDARGQPVLSYAGMTKAVNALDEAGKLKELFGTAGAQRLRDLRDFMQYTRTVPPEAAVNTSNTASTLLAAFADIGGASFSGVPIPIVTSFRIVRQYVKDRALRKRIEDALRDAASKQAPGRRGTDRPQQFPAHTVH